MHTRLKVVDKDGEQEIDVSSDIYDLLPPNDEGVSEYYKHSFTVKDEDTGEWRWMPERIGSGFLYQSGVC
jgi:hypothetical protein